MKLKTVEIENYRAPFGRAVGRRLMGVRRFANPAEPVDRTTLCAYP